MDTKNFSIREAIIAQMERRATVDPQLSERHYRIRGINAATNCTLIPISTRAALTAGGSPIMQEDKQGLLLPLEDSLVLAKAGATVMTGLIHDVRFSKLTSVSVNWAGENEEAIDGVGEPEEPTGEPEEPTGEPEVDPRFVPKLLSEKGPLFTPKRLTAKIHISKQLLVQDGIGVENYLRTLLTAAILQKVEEAAFSTSAAVPNVPDGMFNAAASLGDLTWANVVKLETDADLANSLMGNVAYVTHPSIFGTLKSRLKDATGAGGFIAETGLNGYPAFRTNNIPSEMGVASDEYGIVFGNWADYFVGQWGAAELIADPYTLAPTGMVILTVNSYWDMGFIRPESFSIYSTK